ncbi:MAG: right-handed parallel beta-helix repeat-containing protein, partial [Chloroflexi bacterium]|nr:right-handed parallel beta-helix repeat-containing protein [Chloroflexota bacterium]
MSQFSLSVFNASSWGSKYKTDRLRRLGLAPLLALSGLAALFWLMGALPSLAKPNATTFYVTPDGSGSACTQGSPCSLHTAVANAVNDDEIRAASGTYTNTGAAVITLTQSISLTGGYNAGNWSAPPSSLANPTILDGELTRRVVNIVGDISPIIQNFIIENGRASQGAGINNESGTPIIRSNEVRNNQTDDNPHLGGGIYDGGFAVIESNQIHDNNVGAGQGGGVSIQNGGGSSTQLRLNEIYANSATAGGGVYVRDGSDAFLEANEIFSNTAPFGGGLLAVSFSNTAVTLYSNLFHHNTASNSGGGIYLENADSTLWNNTVADNEGGGIYVFGATVEISNTIVAFNVNDGGANDGIVVSNDGAVTGGYNHVYSDTNSSSGITLTNPISDDRDPLFVERAVQPYNYHLTSGSPAINSGDPNTPAAVDVDIDGQARPFDGAWDIGADEYGDLIEVAIAPPSITEYADKNATATYTHTVRNTGNLPDNFYFDCTNSLGWNVTCPLTVTLDPQQSTLVNTLVGVPLTATALEIGQTAVQVISNLSATVSSTAVINSIVNPAPGLSFTPNYSETVIPGEIITFTHVLTNTGDSADTFTLQMLPGSDWAELLPT